MATLVTPLALTNGTCLGAPQREPSHDLEFIDMCGGSEDIKQKLATARYHPLLRVVGQLNPCQVG